MFPGWLISLLTFPGVVVHELGHKFFCDALGVSVHDVRYFRLGNPAGYVVHETPDTFYKAFLIDAGPLIVNSALTLVIFWALVRAGLLDRSLDVPNALAGVGVWLGISIGMHAFPSPADAKALWRESKRHIRSGDVLAVLGFPVSAVILVADLLSVVWFDAIYAVLLAYLALSLAAP